MVTRVQPPPRGSTLYHMLEDSQAAIFCCCCEVPSPGCARRTASSSPPPTPPGDPDSPTSPASLPSSSSSSSLDGATPLPSDTSPEETGGGGGHQSRPTKRSLSDMGAVQQQQHKEGAGDAERDRLYSPFRRSLFPGVPPTLQFYSDGHQVLPLPACIRKQLRWKVTSITPLLIRQTVVRSGFRLTRDGPYWNGTWGKHIKCFTFAEIKGFQKVNHFPGSFHLGRKDKLWQNVVRLGRIRGEKGRPSLPDTFLLPQELPLLRDAWSAETPGDHCWIIKPPASARGAGVHVVHRWDQIPKKQPLVVQRYVRTPYLINGTKFDLRLYALVTSFDPLKIYLFPDGLVRFASIKYSQECEDLSDRYMHLTNYSINKKSATYTAGGSGDCQGHKWSIKALQGYLEGLGVDFASLWEQMVDIVVKTLACAEGPMNRLIQRHTSSRYTCYELFGFDILLDEQLKPWLLEVNISPSLRSATPVDYTVKSEVVKDMLNLAGFQLPQQLNNDLDERLLECYGLEEQDDLSLNPLLHTYSLSPAELLKHRHYETSLMDVEEETSGLLESLTPDDVRVLVQSEDELSRCGSFKRVFPGGRHGDVTLLAHRRYYNLLLAAWERRFGHQRHKGVEWLQRLCAKGFHLTSPDMERVPTAESQSSPVSEKSHRRKVTRNVNIHLLQKERQHRG
uniref:Tubulin polyglutamylase TTLL4 n=1 Tax=Rhipicephalus appendiculatus TaxID=34631 RepID=A0A131Z147_RHIAP